MWKWGRKNNYVLSEHWTYDTICSSTINSSLETVSSRVTYPHQTSFRHFTLDESGCWPVYEFIYLWHRHLVYLSAIPYACIIFNQTCVFKCLDSPFCHVGKGRIYNQQHILIIECSPLFQLTSCCSMGNVIMITWSFFPSREIWMKVWAASDCIRFEYDLKCRTKQKHIEGNLMYWILEADVLKVVETEQHSVPYVIDQKIFPGLFRNLWPNDFLTNKPELGIDVTQCIATCTREWHTKTGDEEKKYVICLYPIWCGTLLCNIVFDGWNWTFNILMWQTASTCSWSDK